MKLRHYPFRDRQDAGQQLARELVARAIDQPLVLALPRGGVPVAHEIALALHAPLDVLLVRKLGAPMHSELALGAVVGHPHYRRVLNPEVMAMVGPSEEYLAAEEQHQLAEIERRRVRYRGSSPAVPIRGRTVIVVDDGIATGATLKSALLALADAGAQRLMFAVPVAPQEEFEEMQRYADEGICLLPDPRFRAVSLYYAHFDQTSDEEVMTLLRAQPDTARQGPDPGKASGDAPSI
jgi:putative phosphoribosyl transferase